ncbi:hypothetical protein RJ640_004561 [Escallonia rubra]|uniref:UspA domain-containing protein n=1 Tax=Escallonia rubra TaxID=112253 RepID=A0AA88UJU3_9ASTE|nr:hypothetical protein RJ640_004561 [Escallonia rubra]
MQPQKTSPESDFPPLAAIKVKSSSPRFPPPTSTPHGPTETPTAGAQRRIGIAVDLSDESAFAVKWAVHQYLRPGDAVILLHVRPTSVLYGADWGSVDLSTVDAEDSESQQKLESDFDTFTTTKIADLAQPLVDAHIPFKIHIVKDHDMRERLCLEVERLGLSAVIMGSRGFGATRRAGNGRLGSVSDYCVRHCVCPVVVVRYADEKDGDGVGETEVSMAAAEEDEEAEYHDATDDRKDWDGSREINCSHGQGKKDITVTVNVRHLAEEFTHNSHMFDAVGQHFMNTAELEDCRGDVVLTRYHALLKSGQRVYNCHCPRFCFPTLLNSMESKCLELTEVTSSSSSRLVIAVDGVLLLLSRCKEEQLMSS